MHIIVDMYAEKVLEQIWHTLISSASGSTDLSLNPFPTKTIN